MVKFILNRTLRRLKARARAIRTSKGRFAHDQRLKGSARIITLNYWDTREKFAHSRRHNVSLMKHNFAVMNKNLPDGYFVEHHIFLHKVTDNPYVDELIDFLRNRYQVIVHISHMNLAGIGHFHKFNFIAEQSYATLQSGVFDFDFVFTTSHDMFLINHFEENFFVVLNELFDRRDRVRNEELGYYRKDRYDYISHTISATPEWHRFSHNAAVQKGLFRIDRYPYVIESVSQSQDRTPAEGYLGQVLGEKCLYLEPNEYFYHGDYLMEDLTKERVDALLEHASDAEMTKKIIEKIKYQWAGSLHPFWK